MPQSSIADDLRAIRAKTGNRRAVAKPSPEDELLALSQPPKPPKSVAGSALETGKNLGIGALKGVGELGDLVHKTPVLGDLTDQLAKLVGPEGTDPKAAFQSDVLKPEGAAQKMGKAWEQIGEFFLPAGPAKLALIERPVKLSPNATTPAMMAKMNKMAARLGGVGGEAGSAGAVAASHGDQDTDAEMAVAGSAPLVGEAAGKGMTAFLRTPLGKQLAPILLASGVMGTIGGPVAGTIGGAMGMFGAAKRAITKKVSDPKFHRSLERGSRVGADVGGKVVAGGIEQSGPKRRRLQQNMH